MHESIIYELQNEFSKIRLLKAQRNCYNTAKKLYMIRMFISIVLPIISIILYFTFNNALADFILIIGGIGLALSLVLEILEQKFNVKGAKIQEIFDTAVFQLHWNTAVLGDKILNEEIHFYAERDKTPLPKLLNWYTGLSSENEYINILTAQRMNLCWSMYQKSKFKFVLLWSLIALSLIFITIGCLYNFTLNNFFITIIVPSLSLFIYLIKNTYEINQQESEMRRVVLLIEQYIEEDNPTEYQLRTIQDAVYIYGRLPNHIVPNVFYNKVRNKLESIFKSTNKELTSNKS